MKDYQELVENTAYDEVIRDIESELVELKPNASIASIRKLHNIHEHLKVLAKIMNDEDLFDCLEEADGLFKK